MRFIIVLLLFYILPACSGEFDGKNGLKTVYFSNSKKIQQTIEYKNGLRNGLYKEFFKNGNLKVVHHYVNDTLHDTSLTYHENGKLAQVQILNMGRKQGCWKKYNKEGNLYSEICLKDGRLDGPSTVYTYRSGKVLKRVNYKDGAMHGKQETFYNNGKPESISFFNMDNPCLGTEEWDERGNKIKNDFSIQIEEQNKVLMENNLRFLVRLENPRPEDMVYQMSPNDTGYIVTPLYKLLQTDNYHVLNIHVNKGGFVMEKIRVAAFRKTNKGNTLIKTATLIASANNY